MNESICFFQTFISKELIKKRACTGQKFKQRTTFAFFENAYVEGIDKLIVV